MDLQKVIEMLQELQKKGGLLKKDYSKIDGIHTHTKEESIRNARKIYKKVKNEVKNTE